MTLDGGWEKTVTKCEDPNTSFNAESLSFICASFIWQALHQIPSKLCKALDLTYPQHGVSHNRNILNLSYNFGGCNLLRLWTLTLLIFTIIWSKSSFFVNFLCTPFFHHHVSVCIWWLPTIIQTTWATVLIELINTSQSLLSPDSPTFPPTKLLNKMHSPFQIPPFPPGVTRRCISS